MISSKPTEGDVASMENSSDDEFGSEESDLDSQCSMYELT